MSFTYKEELPIVSKKCKNLQLPQIKVACPLFFLFFINGVKQHILNLKKENRLKRFGGRKDGYWKVLDVK